MKAHYLIVVVLAGLPGSGGALAQTVVNSDKSGKIEFDAYVTGRPTEAIDAGVGQGMTYVTSGFDRLVNGNAPFDLLAFQCVGYRQKIGDKASSFGSCVKADKDGDRIFYAYNPEGWTFVGGTGKFKGITGKGTFKATFYHSSGDAGWQLVAHHAGEWEIK